MKILYAYDFFCGAGGLTRGLLDAGIKVLAGFDIDFKCKNTYEHNNSPSKFVSKDIKNITLDELTQYSKKINFSEMLFAGCAPCQPFSQQRKGPRSVEQSTLLLSFARIIEQAKPGFILIENVPGMMKVKGNSTFTRFLRMLDNNGYHYSFEVIDAKNYGVPQNRKRLILLASLYGSISLPAPEYGNSLKKFRTVREAISHFPPISAGSVHPTIKNHVAAVLTPININRMKQTPKDGGDRRSWPQNLYLECHKKNYEGHTDVYGRMHWDRPAPALTARCNSISNGRYGHPDQDRAITLREAAAIQTFPDGYVFFGTNVHIARQIGNAVPVLLAEILGRHIIKMQQKFRHPSNKFNK
ncbi:MAG: putative BsuMI modification methylase subunit YdiO [bacterium ADurb.Bin243]|nr:MAG: putative BsuMI modification methylase subunit YdiO [bacterium ADurb.Bin243]HOD39115.1 DNA cytosine methyltransferase [Candidatus Wallbacteria bacterium]